MKKILNLLFILISLVSCKQNDEPQSVLLRFNDSFFSKQLGYKTSLDLNNIFYENEAGNILNFTTIKYYISGFWAEKENGEILKVGGYNLIDFSARSFEPLLMGNLPTGTYKRFGFNIGVDSIANHSDPTLRPNSSPLSVLMAKDMHWDWNTGYIFMKLEGNYKADSNAVSKLFAIHIGLDRNLVPLTFNVPFTVNVSSRTMTLDVNWDKVFNAKRVIDLAKADFTHSMNDTILAPAVVENLQSLFTLRRVD